MKKQSLACKSFDAPTRKKYTPSSDDGSSNITSNQAKNTPKKKKTRNNVKFAAQKKGAATKFKMKKQMAAKKITREKHSATKNNEEKLDTLVCKTYFSSRKDGSPQNKFNSSSDDGNTNRTNIQAKDNPKKKKMRNKENNTAHKCNATTKFTAKRNGASKRTIKKNNTATKNENELDPKLIKAKLKERINSIPQSEKNVFKLKWTSKPISASDEKKVADKIIVKGCYGPLDAQQMTEIQNHIKSTQVSLSQAISLRSAYLQEKVMYRHNILRKQAKNVCNQYKLGQTILNLAKKADQPPMNVFRVILSSMKWTKNEIKNALRDPKKFQERERSEFLAAESADIVSKVNQTEIHELSEMFEDLLSAWLEQKGIRFVRQKELVEEQRVEFGKEILTPDFLLLDQVDINGVPCHWIDCKGFYGTSLQSTSKKTKQQMTRYIDHWGSGAIVYLLGFNEAIKIKDCALLDAYGALDIKLLSQLDERVCASINRVSLTTFNDSKF